MAKKTYSEEKKAAVLAALLMGQSVGHVAKEYKVPVGTVKGWKSRQINGSESSPVPTQKKAALGDLILGLLEEELIALQAMSRAFRDPDWLRKQNAADAAVLFGVMQDKAFRKIEALDRNARPGN